MPLLAINKNSGQARPISLDDCDATSQNDFIWFHSAENDIQEEDRFFSAMRLAIDPLALADARRRRHPPKFENFGNYLVLLIREIDKDDISEAFRPNHLSIIYGEHFIYTRCTLESAAISQCVNELQTGQVTFKSPDHLVCRIVRLISDSCNSILADIEDQIEDIEDRILVKGTEKDLNYLLSLGNNMKKLGRSLSYQTSAIEELFQLEKAHLLHIYQDIYENTERNASRANLYQSIIADLINGYISINSHHLNRIMKTLTIATVIFLPLSLIAGIYGMNFGYIPELSWRAGYFIVLGVMFTLSITLLYVFRRMKWL